MTEELMMTVNPPRKQLARVIFEKGGDVTVQIGNYSLSYIYYAHHHTSPAEAAQDILRFLDTPRHPGAEGHDPTALVEPSSEEIRSGRYLITTIDEWDPQLEAIARDLKSTGWLNAAEFAERLVSG